MCTTSPEIMLVDEDDDDRYAAASQVSEIPVPATILHYDIIVYLQLQICTFVHICTFVP